MSEEKYYIIEISDNGDVSVTENSPEDIHKLVNPEIDSDNPGDPFSPEVPMDECNTEMPLESNPNYWSKRILIIKGKLVAPKGIVKVTAFEIE